MAFWLGLVTVSTLCFSGYFVWRWFRDAPTVRPERRVGEVTPSQTRLQVRDWMAEIRQQNQSRAQKARQRKHAAFEKRQGA